MKALIVALCICFITNLQAQPEVYIHFIPKVGGVTLTADGTVFHDLNGVGFTVEAFNYYISNLHIIHDGGQDLELSGPDNVILVKMNNQVFNLGVQNITNVEQINFGVGVPLDLNHLDVNSYPLGHPLGFQPNPVMDWGWAAGYKFLALNAIGDSNGDDIVEEMFQLHCLGDANYKNVQLPITGYLDAAANVYHVVIYCNLDEWIFGADPATTGVQHTDFGINADVMTNVETRNVFMAPLNAGLSEIQDIGKVYFSNSEEGTKIVWSEMNGMARYQLVDMEGRIVREEANNSTSSFVKVIGLTSGTYIFNCFSSDGVKIHSMKLVR